VSYVICICTHMYEERRRGEGGRKRKEEAYFLPVEKVEVEEENGGGIASCSL